MVTGTASSVTTNSYAQVPKDPEESVTDPVREYFPFFKLNALTTPAVETVIPSTGASTENAKPSPSVPLTAMVAVKAAVSLALRVFVTADS